MPAADPTSAPSPASEAVPGTTTAVVTGRPALWDLAALERARTAERWLGKPLESVIDMVGKVQIREEDQSTLIVRKIGSFGCRVG